MGKHLLICPDCGNAWPVEEGRYCWLCKSEGEEDWTGDGE
jgi:predicted amidophosphoribosyltransferase